MQGKYNIDGYLVEAYFWGDSITPMYRFNIYEPKKKWWQRNKHLFKTDMHRSKLGKTMEESCKMALAEYHAEIERWQ